MEAICFTAGLEKVFRHSQTIGKEIGRGVDTCDGDGDDVYLLIGLAALRCIALFCSSDIIRGQKGRDTIYGGTKIVKCFKPSFFF